MDLSPLIVNGKKDESGYWPPMQKVIGQKIIFRVYLRLHNTLTLSQQVPEIRPTVVEFAAPST